MTKLYLFVFGVMVVLSQQRGAVQDLMGTWQGVLRANSQGQRTVIKILKDDGGVLQGALYPIDEGGGYLPSFPNDGPRHLRSADHPPFSSHRLRRGTVMDQLLSMLHVSFNRPKAASV